MSDFIGKGMEAHSRPLTSHEQQLVLWLLKHGEAGCDRLVDQISQLTVAGQCTCGCSTIYFAFNGDPVVRRGERLISDHSATVERMDVGVMLFQSGGMISSLEVYSAPGTDKPFGLPNLEDMIKMTLSE